MMKRIVLIVILALFSLAGYAQDHISFQGVPLCGNVDDCVRALRKQKFKPAGPSEMRGKYRGDEVTLTLGSSPSTGEVCLLVVSYPRAASWQALKNQYDTSLMMLSAEYGQPSLKKEAFDYPYSEKDGLRALEYGKCHFTAVWTVPAGEITASMAQDGRLQVFFSDKSGMKQ